MLFLILLSIFTCVLVWKFTAFSFKYLHRRSILKRQFKGPDDVLFIGHAHLFERDAVLFHKQISEYSQLYKDEKAFLAWIGPEAYLICHHPQSVEAVLSSSIVINKADVYHFLHPWLGHGLLTASGDRWRRKRKYLTPAFHFKILQDFIPVFNKNSKILVDIISKEENKTIDIAPLFTTSTLDSITETAMGVSIDAQSTKDSDYVRAIIHLSEDFMTRSKNPLLHNDLLFSISSIGRQNAKSLKLVHDFTEKVIQDRKHYRNKNKIQLSNENLEEKEEEILSKRYDGLAFLDLLLDYQEKCLLNKNEDTITDLDIRDEVDTFMFEGHDTTATALTFTTFLLAKYPEEQRKLHVELDKIFEDDKDRKINSEDLQKMTYLDLVVKEALRLYPSVPYIARKVEQDTKLFGYDIPSGTSLVILTFALHHREDIYPEPNIFKPERFSSANKSDDINPFAYVPFSAGARNCIGAKFASMEEKIVLASIFRKFQVVTDIEEEELAPASQIILRPSKPVEVKFIPR